MCRFRKSNAKIFSFIVDILIQYALFKVHDHVCRRVADHIQRNNRHTGQIIHCQHQRITDHAKFRTHPQAGHDYIDHRRPCNRDRRGSHCRTDG